MTNDERKSAWWDRSRINVGNQWEVRYWAEKLGATEQHIKDAVHAVGGKLESVTRHLKRDKEGGPKG
jgi:hypothetical protein